MATKAFKLPDVGEGVAEGELVQWLVEPGDRVSEDQPVAEVETDKALVEVPSPYDGTVAELRVREGEVVPVGTVLVTFDVPEDGAAGSEADDGTPREAAEGREEGSEGPVDGEDGQPERDGKTGDASDQAPPPRAFAPPSLRRLARELGVDLAAVTDESGRASERAIRAAAEDAGQTVPDSGTGDASARDGRQTAPERPVDGDSVEERESERASQRAGAAPPSPAGRERTLATPATRGVARELGVDIDDVPATERREGEAFVSTAAVRAYAEALESESGRLDAVSGAGDRSGGPPPSDEPDTAGRIGAKPGDRIPYRGVRRSIGERTTRAAFTAPHVTHHDDLDATALVEIRTDLAAAAGERGVRLTYLPFVLKAVTAALQEFPLVNAQLDEEAEEIVLHDEYNVGVATATESGLLVPVVEDVDQKGLLELAREVAGLAERARERTIAREEMQGGTFTVTNVGAIGGEYATPLVNYPEVAILAIGAIRQRPRVVDGEVVARQTLPLSLSVDHRVVDGAVAARFTNRVREHLEAPARLVLE